jgi:hypothetical protein
MNMFGGKEDVVPALELRFLGFCRLVVNTSYLLMDTGYLLYPFLIMGI